MNIEIMKYVACGMMAILLACGKPAEEELRLTGNVDLSAAGGSTGPVFLALMATDDFDRIEGDPLSNIIKVINVWDDGSFDIDLAELGIMKGDTIYLTAFVDNDYRGGIPFPTAGDWAGFYISAGWQTAYPVMESDNSVSLAANRRVYDFTARLKGRILDEEAGSYLVVAYAGDITSMSPAAIDINGVIGYRRLVKPAGPADFEMRIMPYGYDVPINGVHVMALHDVNGNGIPDPGDRIGFYAAGGGLPTMITVNEGTAEGIDIAMQTVIPQPSGSTIRLQGSFTSPSGYDASSKPVFVIVAETKDPAALFENPFSVIREFSRLTPGTNTFDINLSYTGLAPNDEVMVIALWDNDYTGGFPHPTPADKVGFYQYATYTTSDLIQYNLEDFSYTIKLVSDINTVAPSGNWSFNINKVIYNYLTSVQFKIDPSNRPDGLAEDHNLIVLAIHENGVNDDTMCPNFKIKDVNYVLGISSLPFHNDSAFVYGFNIFNVIDERITTPSTMNIYIYVIYDRDGNGTPSNDDDIAAYWRTFWTASVPKKWSLVSDTINVLSSPDDDPDNPYAVKFLGQTY